MNLNDALKSYSDMTQRLIDYIEGDGFEELDKLFQERQKQIELISSLEYSKEEFKLIGDELELLFLEDKLSKTIEKKKNEARINLEKSTKSKQVHNSYNKMQSNSVIFSKKI